VFGAIRIYGALWKFNGSAYPLLEMTASAVTGPGGFLTAEVTTVSVTIAKVVSGATLIAVTTAVWWTGRRPVDDLTLLRRAVVPLAAYLLLTTTVHPWYVTLLAPLLPFLSWGDEESKEIGLYLLAALYFAAVVPLSYVTYLDPESPREIAAVVLLEYVPTYALLLIAAWAAKTGARRRFAG
jgi:hypothetical protein